VPQITRGTEANVGNLAVTRGNDGAHDLGNKVNWLKLIKYMMLKPYEVANFNAVVLDHAYIIACESVRVNLLFQNKVLDWKSLESLTNLVVPPTSRDSNSCRHSIE